MLDVLVLNAGSSSLKYQLVDPTTGRRSLAGLVEHLGDEGRTHESAIAEVLSAVDGSRIAAVGHRVVHGGERFHEAIRIDDEVISAIDAAAPLAPLHNPANLAGIRAARRLLPDVPHVAVFDTAFHLRMPRRARTYAIDTEVAAAHGIRRYGFHGTSHAFVSRRAAEHVGTPIEELRIISLHLGNGASACAIEYGHSVETSMGLTPLEGLVMGTRPGDLDPGVVLELCRKLGVEETDRILHHRAGLAGLSGAGNDLREIEARAAAGDDRARMAIQVFAHRVRKYIGAYAAVMGGVDLIVLTAGIGENGAEMRRRILQRLEFLGVRVDDEKNLDARVDDDHPVADISGENARVRTLVVATNEELQIAREVERLVGGKKELRMPRPIPIAISARHVHLDREAMDVLFGKGSDLVPLRELSQPGQYAAEQLVSLVGPRGRLERVRVLGPLRGRCQIEVSRTDEFLLGIDAPVRRSGQVEASAPITIEGPEGTIALREGLICAWRHIHMTPEDAAEFGVTDGDEVEVAVRGGPRDLVFGDVTVRVTKESRLEMHIDTDEANAAELGSGAQGELVEVYTPSQGATAELRTRR